MFKKVHQYMKQEEYSMGHFMDDKYDIVEGIAFIFICLIYTLLTIVVGGFLLITCPIWIIPYLIYKKRKNDLEQ